MKLSLGVDPGFTGAFAFYNPETNEIEDILDVPLHEIDGKKHVDAYTLARKIDNVSSMIDVCAMENPGVMPGQGISSSGRFMRTCGILYGVLVANFIPVTLVRPNVWKKEFKLGADKDDARRLASSTWPKSNGLFVRKKDDGRAEAALLALYAHKKRIV